MSKKYKVILISGGFDPVHKGHIECIQNAKELADEVWIGLNNDTWSVSYTHLTLPTRDLV